MRTFPIIAVTMPIRLDQSSEVKSFPAPKPKEVYRTKSLCASSSSVAAVVVEGIYMSARRASGPSPGAGVSGRVKAAGSLAPPHGVYSVYDENKIFVAQILHGAENRPDSR